jgi:hypothetical protein
MATKTTQLQNIARGLDALSLAELSKIDAIVHGLIEARTEPKPANEPTIERGAQHAATKRGGRGSIELKMINGCGPYKYLRYWQGGKLKSQYIGKA